MHKLILKLKGELSALAMKLPVNEQTSNAQIYAMSLCLNLMEKGVEVLIIHDNRQTDKETGGFLSNTKLYNQIYVIQIYELQVLAVI